MAESHLQTRLRHELLLCSGVLVQILFWELWPEDQELRVGDLHVAELLCYGVAPEVRS